MSTQLCQAVACPCVIARGHFMCKPHWYALPKPLRVDINAKWRSRQLAQKDDTADYPSAVIDHVEACDEARRWTAEGEGRLAEYVPDAARLQRLYAKAGREPKG